MKRNAFSFRRFPFFLNPLWSLTALMALAGSLFLTTVATPVYAGGGGENMLLIVNPNDEPSLRIANAYVQARHIPVNNILWLAPPSQMGISYLGITTAQWQSAYQSAVPAAIAARGLTNQIDYIGNIGQPHSVNTYSATNLEDNLNNLTQYQVGMSGSGACYRYSELFYYQANPAPVGGNPSTTFAYTHGSNPAVHHSTHYPLLSCNYAYSSGTLNYAQLYMSGIIAYAGMEGLTPTEAINSLRYTIAGDGAKPANATMYFENSGDALRTGPLSPYWPGVQSYLSANNIPWIEENDAAGWAEPTNRKNIFGISLGSGGFFAPNGSVYLPGSFAHGLTSDAGIYGDVHGQSLGDQFILSGAAGSSGCIAEPYADTNRFPMAQLTVYSMDGSTLGEAFYKAIFVPDMNELQGDLLSQPFADIPTVSFTSGPANGATVSGSVTLGGSAFLPNLTSWSTATGIAKLALFVDGVNTGAFVTGSAGAFTLNTTTLTDGMHEVRLVAYNNSQAASEGCAIVNYQVNNFGQSVGVTGGTSYILAASGTQSIPVTAAQGSGTTITGVQLQSLGRTVASGSGASGTLALPATALAYGSNTITPVAILSGGGQVAGLPINVTRLFQPLPGNPPTPLAQRNPGFDLYYYTGAATQSLATTNFSGTPNYLLHSYTFQINPGSSPPLNMPSAYLTSGTGSNVNLAVMGKALFTVTTPGEYSFMFSESSCVWTSFSIAIDGAPILSVDCWTGSTLNAFANEADTCRNVYLLPGEHSLTVKLLNYPSGGASVRDSWMTFLLQFRNPDANQRGASYNTSGYAVGPYFYTVKKNSGH